MGALLELTSSSQNSVPQPKHAIGQQEASCKKCALRSVPSALASLAMWCLRQRDCSLACSLAAIFVVALVNTVGFARSCASSFRAYFVGTLAAAFFLPCSRAILTLLSLHCVQRSWRLAPVGSAMWHL